MPTNAQGSRVRVIYAPEVTFNTAPTDGYKKLRCTGCSLELGKNTFQSQEIRQDRQIADFRHGNSKVSGDTEFEIMPYDMDTLMEALFGGTWSGAVTSGSQSIAVDSSAKTFTRASGSFVSDGFVVGMTIKGTGFSNAGNNGVFVISAVSALVITCSTASGLVTEGSAAARTLTAANKLLAGTTKRSFTIEVGHEDVNVYRRYTGMVADKFSLSMKPGAIPTGKISWLGCDGTTQNTTIDSTLAANQDASPFDTYSGTIKEGGSTIAYVTAIEFNLDNGSQGMDALGADTMIDYSQGRSNVTGTITVYMQDKTLLDKFYNETLTSIEFQLGSSPAHNYKMGSVKYGAAKSAVDGEGPITVQLPFQAIYNSTDGSQVILTRIP